jgi:hypothetical protein
MTERLEDVEHTHPTGASFEGVYGRGPAVTDGSGSRVDEGTSADPAGSETLASLDHAGSAAVTAAFSRGTDAGARPESDGASER